MIANTQANSRVVLALGAHPDDVEISCAGTLQALSDLGYSIHIATMTLGDCGSKELPAEQVRQCRRGEAEDACRILRATHHYVGSNDFSIFNDDIHNRLATALLREVAPAIVFTHSPGDYILDHDNTSVLARNACFYAPANNYDCSQFTSSPALTAIPHLYYWDVMEGVDIFGKPVVPEFYVNITDGVELKTQMLAAHRSQGKWLRDQHGIGEYVNSMRAWGARRGEEAESLNRQEEGADSSKSSPVMYAEAFRQHLGHAYPRDNILKSVLQGRVVVNPSY